MDLTKILIYHITDVSNLPNILAAGGMHSEANLQMAGVQPTIIGHSNIKQRRLHEITVPCCGNRFVGEFVPFYFCPRSPMLFTINRGNTGRTSGCQNQIVHLVSSMEIATGLGKEWAFSSGNAGAYLTDFFADVADLSKLDWGIIRSTDWAGEFRRDKKAAEFLVADFFPWAAVREIGCYNSSTKQVVETLLQGQANPPKVVERSDWYY